MSTSSRRTRRRAANNSSSDLDRRTFLKRSGVAAGALALGNLPLGGHMAEAGPLPPAGATVTTWKNFCTHCSVGCSVIAEVANGVWIGQEPDYDSPINRGCIAAKERQSAMTCRATAACVTRKNWWTANGNGSPGLRPSMRSAINFWISARRRRPGFGLLARVGQIHQRSGLPQPQARRLLGTNNSDHQARICHSTTVTGVANTWGYGALTNSYNDIRRSRPSCSWAQSRRGASSFVTAHSRQDSTARISVVDPRMAETGARDQYVRVRPGVRIPTIMGCWHIFKAAGRIGIHPSARLRHRGYSE
jgi:formate dehydrogenase major subunit